MPPRTRACVSYLCRCLKIVVTSSTARLACSQRHQVLYALEVVRETFPAETQVRSELLLASIVTQSSRLWHPPSLPSQQPQSSVACCGLRDGTCIVGTLPCLTRTQLSILFKASLESKFNIKVSARLSERSLPPRCSLIVSLPHSSLSLVCALE